MTAFKRKVLLTVKSIPRGKTASYSRIAEEAGYPRACRAVGNVMATNPFPPIVPCHRVVRSNREIGNFGSGIKLKRRMLTQEKVVFEGEKIAVNCLLN
jgi:methylated-DNA-[protein]-cysteine S-methyltransferase